VNGLAGHVVVIGLPLISNDDLYSGYNNARLTVLKLSSSTVGAQFGRASLIDTAQSRSIPPLPLQHSTLTRLAN